MQPHRAQPPAGPEHVRRRWDPLPVGVPEECVQDIARTARRVPGRAGGEAPRPRTRAGRATRRPATGRGSRPVRRRRGPLREALQDGGCLPDLIVAGEMSARALSARAGCPASHPGTNGGRCRSPPSRRPARRRESTPRPASPTSSNAARPRDARWAPKVIANKPISSPCRAAGRGSTTTLGGDPQHRSPREISFHRLSFTPVPVATALNRPPNRGRPTPRRPRLGLGAEPPLATRHVDPGGRGSVLSGLGLQPSCCLPHASLSACPRTCRRASPDGLAALPRVCFGCAIRSARAPPRGRVPCQSFSLPRRVLVLPPVPSSLRVPRTASSVGNEVRTSTPHPRNLPWQEV